MEAAPYTSESSTDKSEDKTETSGSKKKDKSAAAHDMAKTIFNAEAAAPQKETTLWDRLTGEREPKDAKPEASPAEDAATLADAAQAHIVERQAAVHDELQHTDPDSSEAVAVASDAALLEYAREQFDQPEAYAQPIEALDTAYAQAAEDIDQAVADASQEAADTPEVDPPRAEAGAGENVPPPPPPPSGAETGPATPDMPPEPPPPPFAAAAAHNTSPAVTETVSERDRQISANTAYRQGRSEGLLTGGVLGFLYGRRRGRKKAEKRFKPIQARLEKQLKHITDKLTHREQDIRTLASQKLEQAPQPVRYDKVAEQLKPAPLGAIPEQRNMPLQEVIKKETMPQPVMSQPEAAPAAPRPEKIKQTAAELAHSRSEYAGVVPFNTSEQMSDQELKAIAQKIVIDHIPLREMYEAQQFDHKGLRRIVNEFLRGGDVQRALTNEVIRKDKAFELDPRLRKQAAAGDAATGGGAAGTIDGQFREMPQTTASRREQLRTQAKRLPELSQAAMADLKRHQVLSVAGVTLAVIIAIILALVITS